MNGLTVVPTRSLGETLRHSDNFCPFSPSVAVTVQRDAGNARLVTTAAETAGPVALGKLREIRKQRASSRQLLQNLFQPLADRELCPRAGLLPEIGDGAALPVNILGGH